MSIATDSVTTVSPRSLNVVRECHRCFWLEKNACERPTGPVPTIGRSLDTIIRRWWDEARAGGSLPPPVAGDTEFASLGARPVDPRLTGWTDPATCLKLVGRLDACLQLPSGLYVPVDHKTRGYAPKEVHPAYATQLDAYSLMLEKNERPCADFGVLLYFVPDGGDPEAGTTWSLHAQSVSTDPQRAYELMLSAQRVLALSSPPPHADACSYGAWTGGDTAYP